MTAGVLHLHAGGNFRVGQHGQVGERGFEEAAEGEADLRGAEHAPGGWPAESICWTQLREHLHDVPGQFGLDDQGDFGGGLAHALGDLLFESRIEGDGAQAADFGLIGLGDLRRPARGGRARRVRRDSWSAAA